MNLKELEDLFQPDRPPLGVLIKMRDVPFFKLGDVFQYKSNPQAKFRVIDIYLDGIMHIHDPKWSSQHFNLENEKRVNGDHNIIFLEHGKE